jgi:hypothetical protein
MRSNFQYPKIIGNQTLSIDNVSGGVRFDSNERRRVDDLSAKILGENGFISRIIVDQDNNVIEGQHRLEALRQLGANEVPVYKIEDLSSTLPVIEMENAINSAGKIHPDHTNQIIQYALENIAQHGFDGARDFNFGKYQNHYDAALKAASTTVAPEAMAGGGAIRKAAEAVRQAADSDLDMSTEGVAPADIKKSFIVNPKSLIFRETEQSQANKDSLTGDSEDFDPIVVIGNDLKNLSILDGHHRASVARDRGDSLQAVRVTESEYDLLKKKGFDDTEIAYAALQRANKGYAAGNLDSQFKGSGIADNGDRAWDVLLSEDDPEGMSKGGLVDKLRSAASSVKEAGNVYKAAVGNMFSPFEPVEPQLGDPNDYEYPELRLRRPGIVNLALGMPNMPADMRYLFGDIKDAVIGDEVPDEEWRTFDTATEAQGRYEDDMDAFLRAYTGKSVDELSGPMSAVLGVSEALAQPGIIPAKLVAGLPRAARYLSNLAEFATPVTVASPGAMLTGAGFNAGIRVLPALTDGDDLEQMNARYSGRELSGEEQDRLDKYLQELLGKKDGGLIDRINQSFYENISKPAVGTAIDMTLGLGDLAQMAARYLGNKAGFDAGEFTSVAQPVKEAIGVDDYNPYTIGGVGASILPFAAAGRTAQAINAAPAGVRQIQAALPNLGRESAAYVGAEAAGAGAREFMPDSPMAELFANVAGGMGGSALGSQPTSMGIIKEKGGNWLAGSIEDELGLLHNINQGMRADTPTRQLAEMEARFTPESIATLPQHTREFVQQNIDQLRSRAQIDNWIDSKLNKYIRNDMATQSDPIRLHAESFQAEKTENLARKDEQIARAMDNLERTRLERGVTANDLTRSQAQIRELQRERALIAAQTGLHINPDEVGINRYLAEDIRKGQGYPQLGASRTARAWEDASDVAVFPSTAGTHLTYSADSVLDDNPWLAKIPPESKTYELRQTGFAHNFRGLGFDHMMDELRNATAPNSDLPENLRIDPNNLSGMSVPEIVKKIDKINAWRYVNRAEVDAVRANNAATIPFKEYDAVPYRSEPNTEGLKWVQLARTEDTPEADAALNDALEYEGNMMNHSVGGYRTPDRGGSQDYGLGGWDAITSDRARIYSLRDASGKPHATIEVLSNPVRYNDIVREVGIKTASEMSNRGMTVEQMAQAIPNFKMPARITQIKGLNNKIPDEQYLPFVQDFVLGQDWSDIGDFHHTGLKRLYSDSDLAKAMRDAGQTPPYYVTNEELTQLHRQYPVGYAQGGLVYDADAINALAAQLMEPQGYAGGGAIRKAAEAIGAARTLPPLENAQKTQLGSSTIPSYAKAREILSSKKRILDFGAGRGQGASLIGADTFEPYPREGFSPSYNSVTDIPSGSYDGLTSLNVLNVMPREVRDDAVRNIGRVLMDGGEAVITTRGRDVMTANGVDGPEPMSRITTADTYQKGFTQQELIDYVSNVLGEGYVVSSLPQKVGAAGVLVKKVGRNAESASDASLEGLAKGGSPRSRLGRAAAAIRGATGTKPVQTEAGSDSLENLYDHYVSLGYPEGTARKIASGDLLMDTDSRMQRAAELGYTEPMYVGTSSGADILEFDPDIGTGARQRTGTWGSADKLNANTYASLPKGQMYQLLMKPSEQAEINAGGKNWSMLPSDSTMTLNDGVQAKLSEAGYTRRNTNDLARLARLYGADSLRVNNVRDMGPYGLFEEDVPEFSDTLVVFKPELLRSKLSAAFDPDETKNRNILAGGSGVGLGLGALLASSEEEPQEFSGGGKIRKAAAAVRGAATPPREIPDEQRVSDEEMMRIARDLGVDVDETDVLTDMPMPSITQYTAADRAAAGRRAASLIRSQDQMKASEALGRLMEQGFTKTSTTQADRTRVGGGNIGGPAFPVLGEVDPEYAGRSWGVMNQGTASRLMNLSSPETAWTTMLGSSDQLKSNPIVFDKLKKAFLSSMRQGNLSPELESKINQNLRLTFGEGANIRDPNIWNEADTFAKRAALADLLMGQGTAPAKGGVALGGEKSGRGVIFKPSEILMAETERGLLHPEHGGNVPTFALGPRLFTIGETAEYRPDLHPGFPTLLEGRDLGYNVIPTPTEVYLPDWHRRYKSLFPERKPGYYELTSGLPSEGLPSQDLTDDYIRHLIREGFSQGGLANYRDMIRSN